MDDNNQIQPVQDDVASQNDSDKKPLRKIHKKIFEKTDPVDKYKPEVVEKKKKSFFRLVKLVLLGFLVLIVISIIIVASRYLYIKTKENYVVVDNPDPVDSTEVIIVEPEPEPEPTPWDTYVSSKYKFNFKYPSDDTFEIDEEENKEYFVRVSYKDIIPNENAEGKNLVQGYILTINPIEIVERDLNTIANIKKEWFHLNCPQSANIEKVRDITLDNINGKGFNVYQCNCNYVVSYIPSDDHIFEIIQMYKGDVGFSQNFKSIVKEINDTIVINLESEKFVPFRDYDNSRQGYSFEYSSDLELQCCEVKKPPNIRTTSDLVVGETDSSNAVGFYITSTYGLSLSELVENQKRILIEDYRVTNGVDPQGQLNKFEIDGKEAYELKDYSWLGIEYTYVKIKQGRYILIIVRNGLSDEYYNHIIETMKIE